MENSRRRQTQVADLFAAIQWPLVVLVLALVSFVVFREPLNYLIYRADTVELGKFKLHVDADQLRTKLPKPSDEVASVLTKLDLAAIEELLSTPPGSNFCDNPDQIDSRAAIRPLGLVNTMEKLPGLERPNPKCKTFTSLSDKGIDVRSYLTSLISTLISQSNLEAH